MRKIFLCISAMIGLALASTAFAAPPILRVIVVQTTDLKAYLHEIDTLRADMKKAGISATLRAWRARFAGADAGAIVVSVEMADLTALAKLDDAMASNAEIAATMKRIGALRKIVSDSLYEELKP